MAPADFETRSYPSVGEGVPLLPRRVVERLGLRHPHDVCVPLPPKRSDVTFVPGRRFTMHASGYIHPFRAAGLIALLGGLHGFDVVRMGKPAGTKKTQEVFQPAVQELRVPSENLIRQDSRGAGESYHDLRR